MKARYRSRHATERSETPGKAAIVMPLRESEVAAELGLKLMVYSKALEETVFFCEDEATKAALIEAGASEWSIYTKDELRILCEQNRVAPLCPDELRKVHEIKRTFNGRIAK